MAKNAGGTAEESPVLKPWPKCPARLAHAVVESLTDIIVSGALPPGSTLPVEPGLCETFGVSRITVREAVKSLEPRAWSAPGRAPAPRSPSPRSGTCWTPSCWPPPFNLQAIERMLGRLDEETTTPVRFDETDLAFHDRIMQASRNRLGRSIIRTVHTQARTTLLYTGAPDTTGCRQANAEHRKVVERLLARDPEGAAQAMTEHIEAAWRRRRLPSAAPPAP